MIKINDYAIKINRFPDGTYNLINNDILDMIDDLHGNDDGTIDISWLYDSEEEISLLYYIANYLHEIADEYKLKLFMPYLPNARMDRIHGFNEIFTLKYFCKLINSLKFYSIYSYDVHSYVSEALLDRFSSIFPGMEIQHAINDSKPTLLYFPDEGAMKRYSDKLKNSGIPYIYGMKVRDWSTGEIKGIEICGDKNLINGANILIIDDICSKGGTFYHSAGKLKEFNPNKIDLYVTHCEKSIYEGLLLVTDLISTIYTTDSILHDILSPKIKIVNTFRSAI